MMIKDSSWPTPTLLSKGLLRTKLRLLIALTVVVLCLTSYSLFGKRNNGLSSGAIVEITHDHEAGHGEGENRAKKFVVDTSVCKIPELDPFDASIQNFLKPDFGYPVDCWGTHRAWTFVNGTTLLMNSTAIHESGYSKSSIYCCYRIIERVEQPLSDYDLNADNYVKYSERCHILKDGQAQIDADFIRVHCISKSVPLLNDVVYRDFFAIPQSENDRLVARKLKTWKAKSNPHGEKHSRSADPPPNVVIIGIDNNSRMNSHRQLKKTLETLRSLGAVELMGYTKVGENTFPNTVPFLSGYNEKEFGPICYSSNADPQDDCPYVWKAFDQLGYLTVHAEDAPYLGGFNYLKTGFLRKPTDFYLRPLMLAVMTYMPRFDYYHTDCIGRYKTEEFVFNYILDIVKLAKVNSAPIFVHSWLTSLAHHSYNNLQYGDESTANFIEDLVQLSDDNTIFFFMSDHGQRYGPIRETSQGWYEDKLPTHWVYLPKSIRLKFPQWQPSLEQNARRLSSHFDLYKSLLHILKSYTTEDNSIYDSPIFQKGQSLFEYIPENRTCADAGITVNFCACSKPEPIDVNSEVVTKAAETAVRHLASLVPLDVCAVPTLKSVVGAKYINIPLRPVYLVSLYTDPGDFLFEVNVEIELSTGKFVINTDFLRMNKISRPANCVNSPLLERYCYCK